MAMHRWRSAAEKQGTRHPAESQAGRSGHRAATIHVYAAGHGFNCEARRNFAPDSAALAWHRITALFDEALK